MISLNQSRAKGFIPSLRAGPGAAGPSIVSGHAIRRATANMQLLAARTSNETFLRVGFGRAPIAGSDWLNRRYDLNGIRNHPGCVTPAAPTKPMPASRKNPSRLHDSRSIPANIPVTAATRAALLGHRGVMIWLTGLSGAGKSTLATGLEEELFHAGVLPAVVDGDVLRTGLSHGLGFSDADRKENIRRAAEAALLLAEAGAVAITALISPFREDRQQIADRCRLRGIPFAEIYVNASLAACEARDPKGLYRKARAGLLPSFTGIDSPYEPPPAPALELHTDYESVAQSLEKLTALTLRLARPPASGAGARGANI
jgi:adenylyl-sulfate kinase